MLFSKSRGSIKKGLTTRIKKSIIASKYKGSLYGKQNNHIEKWDFKFKTISIFRNGLPFCCSGYKKNETSGQCDSGYYVFWVSL